MSKEKLWENEPTPITNKATHYVEGPDMYDHWTTVSIGVAWELEKKLSLANKRLVALGGEPVK